MEYSMYLFILTQNQESLTKTFEMVFQNQFLDLHGKIVLCTIIRIDGCKQGSSACYDQIIIGIISFCYPSTFQ